MTKHTPCPGFGDREHRCASLARPGGIHCERCEKARLAHVRAYLNPSPKDARHDHH